MKINENKILSLNTNQIMKSQETIVLQMILDSYKKLTQ